MSSFDRNHDSMESFLDGTTQVHPRAFEIPESRPFEMPEFGRAEVNFRSRDGRETRRRPQRNTPRMIAIGLGVAAVLACGALAWSFAIPHATTASSASTVAAASASKLKASKSKKRKRTRKAKSASSSKVSSLGGSTTNAHSTRTASAVPTAAASRSVASVAAARTGSLASGDVVVIDAGHQAHGDSSTEPIGPGSSQRKPKVSDGGAGPYAPYDESAINLAVALKLRDELTSRGVKVVMVRTSQDVNISNSERAAIANRAHAALFVRIHCDDVSNSSLHGFSTLVPASNSWTRPIVAPSAKAGRFVQAAALKATDAADRGIVDRGDLTGFNWCKVPAILVEMGFMSNRAEDRQLTTSAYQHELAVGIANGVVEYLGSK